MLERLSRGERLRLLQFVCSFAWADLEVRPEERCFVANLMDRLALDAAERDRVRAWLESPPSPEDVDPMAVPPAHRKLFLEAAEGVIRADGRVVEDERVQLELFRDLLGE